MDATNRKTIYTQGKFQDDLEQMKNWGPDGINIELPNYRGPNIRLKNPIVLVWVLQAENVPDQLKTTEVY